MTKGLAAGFTVLAMALLASVPAVAQDDHEQVDQMVYPTGVFPDDVTNVQVRSTAVAHSC